MSENDYIAEHVREKHPDLLGPDYAIWKTTKVVKESIGNFCKALEQIDFSQLARALKDFKESNPDFLENKGDENAENIIQV